MVSLPIEKTDEDEGELDSSVSLICTITFTGSLLGVFAIRCSIGTAEKIARAMLMSKPDNILNESKICDALGEITNIILGGVKARMNNTISDIQISIPSIIKGLEIRPSMGKKAAKVSLITKTNGEIMKLIMMYKSEG